MEEKISMSKRATIGVVLAAGVGAVLSLFRINVFSERPAAQDPIASQLDNLTKTDPALSLYEESAPRIKTTIEGARLIDVDDDDVVYIAGGGQVRGYDKSGGALPLRLNTDSEITALTVHDDGAIYLGLSDHLAVYNANGALQKQWQSIGANGLITSIAIYQDHIFLADAGAKVIHHYHKDGGLIKSFGDFNIPSPYFDLQIAGENQLYAANTGEHRIETYNFDGDMTAWWGAYSMTQQDRFCGCCNPIHFSLLPNNEGFITCEKGIARIKIYDADTEFVGYVAAPSDFSEHDVNCHNFDTCFSTVGVDAAVDSTGRVIVMEPVLGELRFYRRKPNSATIG